MYTSIVLLFLVCAFAQTPVQTQGGGGSGTITFRQDPGVIAGVTVGLVAFSVIVFLATFFGMRAYNSHHLIGGEASEGLLSKSSKDTSFSTTQKVILIVLGGVLLAACIAVPLALFLQPNAQPANTSALATRSTAAITTVTTRWSYSANGLNIVIEGYNGLPIIVTLDLTVVGSTTKHYVARGSWVVLRTFPKQSFTYNFRYWEGATTTIPVDYAYGFPYSGTFNVGQGNFGTFSHNQLGSYHAYDITMPQGTPIKASRPGIVSYVRSDLCCPVLVAGSPANVVIITHSDNTQAIYAHLRQNGVTVAVGASVTAGQVIGYSGNTGYSTGPHLHIAVLVPQGQAGTTPTTTMKFGANKCILKQGQTYPKAGGVC